MEDAAPFISVCDRLTAAGLHAPTIAHADLDHGFLIIEDLGTTTYLDVLEAGTVDTLYGDALNALERMQQIDASDLPDYDTELLNTEMSLFSDWLLARHLNRPLSDAEQVSWQQINALLASSALEQPAVFVHRDYHCRNLMQTEQNNPGIIDFQDAVSGPLTYDLVSLLRDCYISWPQQTVDAFVELFHARSRICRQHEIPLHQFRRWFDLMGVQRHLKASGIFCRLWHRDGKSGYLNDIPGTLTYIVKVGASYPELAWLCDLISNEVLPALSRVDSPT